MKLNELVLIGVAIENIHELTGVDSGHCGCAYWHSVERTRCLSNQGVRKMSENNEQMVTVTIYGLPGAKGPVTTAKMPYRVWHELSDRMFATDDEHMYMRLLVEEGPPITQIEFSKAVGKTLWFVVNEVVE